MTKVKKVRDEDFTEGTIFFKLIMFALPLMATGLLQTLYNASDMVIVGNFAIDGTNAMGAVRGMGKAMIPMFVSLTGSCLFRVVWILTVCAAFPDDIKVLYYCYPISWTLTAAAHFICCLIIYKIEYKPKLLAQKTENDGENAVLNTTNT